MASTEELWSRLSETQKNNSRKPIEGTEPVRLISSQAQELKKNRKLLTEASFYNKRLAEALEKYGGGREGLEKARAKRKAMKMQRRQYNNNNNNNNGGEDTNSNMSSSEAPSIISIDSDEERMSPHYKEYMMNLDTIKYHLAARGEFEEEEEVEDSPSTRGDKILNRINRIESSLTREIMFKDLLKLNRDMNSKMAEEDNDEDKNTIFDTSENADWMDHLPPPRPPNDSGKLPPSFKKPTGMLEALSTPAFQSKIHRLPLSRGDWKPSGKDRKKKTYASKKNKKTKGLQIFGKDGKPLVTLKPIDEEKARKEKKNDDDDDGRKEETNSTIENKKEEEKKNVDNITTTTIPTLSPEEEQHQKDIEALKAKIKRVRIHSFKPIDRFGNKTENNKNVVVDFRYTYEAEHAALRIQKLWRGYSDRCFVLLPGGAKEQWSATKIQRIFRMMTAWREYELYKEVKAIEYELHQKHGSVLVRVARGFNARVFARKYRKERTDACVIIQKIFRGWYQRERGKMRLATYKKWKAMAIQKVWRGHCGRQRVRALKFQRSAIERLTYDPDAQWGVVQVIMRLFHFKRDFRKIRLLINDKSIAPWHKVLRRPRVDAEGKPGTLLIKPSSGVQTRLYAHAMWQVQKDKLCTSMFPKVGVETFIRKMEIFLPDHSVDDHQNEKVKMKNSVQMYFVVAIYEQVNNNLIIEIFDPETHCECVPIIINNEELKEMCYLDPGMLSKGRRYIDLRRWIAKSLALSKTGSNGGVLKIRCPPLERARNRLIKHRAATHIIRVARGFMSKCRVKRIVALMQEQVRQRKRMEERLKAMRKKKQEEKEKVKVMSWNDDDDEEEEEESFL